MTIPQLAAFPKGFFDAIVDRRMSLLEWFDLAATLDVDGVELYPAFLESSRLVIPGTVRREAEARGLAVPMMCHSSDFTHPGSGGAQRRGAENPGHVSRHSRTGWDVLPRPVRAAPTGPRRGRGDRMGRAVPVAA